MRPHVIADSFIFHGDITAIGVTDTRSGITTREVLFATANGQLHAVSRMLLDARRPHKLGSAMTTEEREEMLVPYQPTIDVHPKEVLSYTLDVRNVRAITTSRTTIESTTLIFARGLDLFFTRRMPSKSFDVLGEEFSRGMLLMLMGSLAAGIIVAKHMVAEKKLNKAWE